MEKPIDFANLPLYYGHKQTNWFASSLKGDRQYPQNNLAITTQGHGAR